MSTSNLTREEARATLLAKLAEHGLDGAKISQEGVCEEGYFSYQKGESGERRIPEAGRVATFWQEWPTSLDYEEIRPLIDRVVHA